MRSPEGLPVHIPVQHGRDGEHGSGTGAGAGQDASQQARGEAGVRAFGEQDGVVEVLARGLTVGGVGVQPQQFPGQGELAAGCRDHGGCAAAGARYGGEHGRLGQEFVAGDVPLHRAWGHVVGAPGDDPAHARGVVHRVRPSGVLVGVGGLQGAGLPSSAAWYGRPSAPPCGADDADSGAPCAVDASGPARAVHGLAAIRAHRSAAVHASLSRFGLDRVHRNLIDPADRMAA